MMALAIQSSCTCGLPTSELGLQLWEAIGDTNRRVSDDGADIEVMSGRVSALDAKVCQPAVTKG